MKRRSAASEYNFNMPENSIEASKVEFVRRHAIVPLGEELPIFCERCGYSLFGLPQKRCECCEILYFSCPECNHHQPINTLRPAVQRVLGRMRATILAGSVLVRAVFFMGVTMIWFALGGDAGYRYNWAAGKATLLANHIDPEVYVGVTIFGLGYGLVGRMLLLRWKRGYAVGAVTATLAAVAFFVGPHVQRWDYERPPLSPEFYAATLLGWTGIVAGAATAWPIWMSLVHLFLPKRIAAAVLRWQRGDGDEARLARE